MLPVPTLKDIPNLAVAVRPTAASDPGLIGWNEALAKDLGLTGQSYASADLARLFSGSLDEATQPAYALAYAGHQFGQFVPQLGDGRAALIGELVSASGRRYDVQLKGSGRTPFSRGGDGKSALGPVIREYIVSEAMHALGIPTTRALAAVTTGDTVVREYPEPGGVLTRVAASHLRVGTFQYFAARGDAETIRALVDYAIERHYPEVARDGKPVVAFFRAIASAQAALVADWMSVGFVHGVMNTDNCSIAGETLDYGPCAFLDEFRHDKVFSSIDHGGRYAYSNQPLAAQWNLARLAECLLLVCDELDLLTGEVENFSAEYESGYYDRMCAKLGIENREPEDQVLVDDLLALLEDRGLDYTLAFRQLADRIDADGAGVFETWEGRWRSRLSACSRDVREARAAMNRVNPLFIPRNHRVEDAISKAVDGDLEPFHTMNEVLRTPYADQPGFESYSRPPAPEERVTRTFCGT